MAMDKLTEEIHRIMEEGKRSQLHGWDMRDIVSKITASYGKGVGTKAKKYILSYVPSYDPTQKENKDV
jgi:hypothetical protein|tara:strand:+ start:280 stop:483 length:204 start_codon:yes stop_codon:yes gene_type:complete